MEKQVSVSASGSGNRELQCVGRLEIARQKPAGFLCGSIPVTTEGVYHDSAALVPSSHTMGAPRYRMIPAETDLNALPLLSSLPEEVLPIAVAAPDSRSSGDFPWQGIPVASSLTRKGEALAVSGMVEYGDEIDVIAPADILKQIFKIPYSKARVSIAVRRVGPTLILNTGPDIEEGEKLIRRHNRQPKCEDPSLFLNFAMHSVRMEACDCPPSHRTSSDESYKSSMYPNQYMSSDGSLDSSNHPVQGHASYKHNEDIDRGDGYIHHEDLPLDEKENLLWGQKKKRKKGREAVKKVSDVKEKPKCPIRESDNYRKVGDNGFLRVLFWQFHNFRMLLGSDLLIFSNEKYVAVSLHLWDVSQKVTPLTWLEAWLDNFMASVPEMAICYHQDGVVQGYELLKTDDIFLVKGISDDGTSAFHPQVVQQNGLSVMRFLQENCKQDPGAYWLYKSAGEDVIQLFDLSVIPKNHAADGCHDSSVSLPSLICKGRNDSILSLGTLLYRIAHRLSLSMSPHSRARCARFFHKCLNLLDEPDYLVVRALAHEQYARLLLSYDEEMELSSEVLRVESEVTIADAEEDEFISGLSALSIQDTVYPPVVAVGSPKFYSDQHNAEQNSTQMLSGEKISLPIKSMISDAVSDEHISSSEDNDSVVCNLPKNTKTADQVVQTVADPLSSKLAAIHHVSQAIKSLRWTRQLQSTRPELNSVSDIEASSSSTMDFSVCVCGDPDCIEVCDIREWLPISKIDDKLWKLVLLLGESYLALGEAYKNGGELYQALKVIELACLVYGSMPQDNMFISSMVPSLSQVKFDDKSEKTRSSTADSCLDFDGSSSNYLFWAKAWTLVGDVFVEIYLMKGQEDLRQVGTKDCVKDLKMSSEVLKEVERLKKKMGKFKQNCSSCSLVNCSCQSDRASSGSSASSSSRGTRSPSYSRKQGKKSHGRNIPFSRSSDHDNGPEKGDYRNTCGGEKMTHLKTVAGNETFRNSNVMNEPHSMFTSSERADISVETDNVDSADDTLPETTSKQKAPSKSGGIFKYLRDSTTGDADYTLSVALDCYAEAQKAMSRVPSSSADLHTVVKKKGWVCNELGRNRLERKDLSGAETAFAEAINAFRQVEDHTNIILINCNLGHGRRALAEDMVPKIENLRKHAVFLNSYLQALETAKLQYSEALRYYGAAKTELSVLIEKESSVSSSLKNEVNTQFAHTYLKIGMLLARENTVAEVYENGVLEECSTSSLTQTLIEHRKHEISANDAIREALSVYESLGELRRQETAYAYFQLGSYHRDCCLRFLQSHRKNNLAKGESSVVQKVKQYSSLAERNWQKSMDFYLPETHPVMYLTLLVERSALLYSISSYLHSYTLLESALTCQLEGCCISENTSLSETNPEICTKFWSQLQKVLKSMLTMTRSTKANKYPVNSQQAASPRSADAKKLSELYKISLKSPNFSQLHVMHSLYTA